jgi:hypothetical protein
VPRPGPSPRAQRLPPSHPTDLRGICVPAGAPPAPRPASARAAEPGAQAQPSHAQAWQGAQCRAPVQGCVRTPQDTLFRPSHFQVTWRSHPHWSTPARRAAVARGAPARRAAAAR